MELLKLGLEDQVVMFIMLVQDMNQLINMKLHAELYYAAAMIKTMKLCNGLCNDIAPIAFKMGTANIRTISDACYRIMREKHTYQAKTNFLTTNTTKLTNRYTSLQPEDHDQPPDADTPGTELTAEEVVEAKSELNYIKGQRDVATK